MNFANAVKVADPETRNSLIEHEIEEESWDDFIDPHLHRGGWPDDVVVEKIDFDEDVTSVIAHLNIHFLESVPSGCRDINHNYPGTAYLDITINKMNGDFEIDDLDVDTSDESEDDDDIYEGDYY